MEKGGEFLVVMRWFLHYMVQLRISSMINQPRHYFSDKKLLSLLFIIVQTLPLSITFVEKHYLPPVLAVYNFWLCPFIVATVGWSGLAFVKFQMAALEASRQEYLKKRELKKIEQLRDSIEDYVFDGIKLTEAEYQDLRYRKELYELVKKRPREENKSEEYRIPEAYDQEGHVNQKK